METILHFGWLLGLLGLIVWACIVFTNAIEHLGKALNLGHGAVGSVFAAVGTALPETIVPLVAIIGGFLAGGDMQVGHEIGIGAILGAPFLLSTLAMFFIGFFAIIFTKMGLREKGIHADYHFILRDFKFFFVSYTLAVAAGFIHIKPLKWTIAVFLLLYYCYYVYRTITKSKADFEEGEELEELMLMRVLRTKKAHNFLMTTQIIISLIMLVLFAHMFVEELKYFSVLFKINPLVLSLIITPIATELPEKVNSILWIKCNKDTLALGNVTGAMVFQSAIPTAVGILLTPWVFEINSIANIIAVYGASITICALALIKKRLLPGAFLLGGAFYLAFLAFVAVNILKG